MDQCKRCGQELDVYWVSMGTWEYKLGKCIICNEINILESVQDQNIDVNNDKRFYEYRRKTNVGNF